MLEPALPIKQASIAFDKPTIRRPPDIKARLRDLGDRLLGLLKVAGEFFASGGPLS